MSAPRVRFAPSPTGELHIGGARTALFNYLFARGTGGVFVLRIDDTDLERSRDQYIDKLVASMKWLGLDWDEGPYSQSQRLEIYREEAEILISGKLAYHCFCTTEELESGREAAKKEGRTFLYPGTCRNLSPEKREKLLAEGQKPVVRLLTPDNGQTVVSDMVRGEVSFENSGLDDFIIMKSNGLPTYNFASIIDDLKMEITHVIRAEEHLSNTPRQQLCAMALGYKLPIFAHVPMILAPDRSKLSKRHGATSVEEFKDGGYLPEALINYIVLLGWSPGGEEEEIMSMDELAAKFSLDKVTKTAAIYDVTKLTWMNGNYIRDYPIDQLISEALPFYENIELVTRPLEDNEQAYLEKVVETVRERAKTLAELAQVSTYFYRDDYDYDQKGAAKHFQKEGVADLLRQAAGSLLKLSLFNAEAAEEKFNNLCEELDISKGRLIAPTRLALTGRMDGPGLFAIMEVLGREKTAARLFRAAEFIETEF